MARRKVIEGQTDRRTRRTSIPNRAMVMYEQFSELGGRVVDLAEIEAELSNWPIDAVLGILGALSRATLVIGPDYLAPEFQGHLLKDALIDDFPTSLPGLSSRIQPGYAPRGESGGVLVHAHNLAWLAHQALLHTQRDTFTPDLQRDLKVRVMRLLLIANDHISETTIPSRQPDLRIRREFALDWLRHWQFSQSYDFQEVLRDLLRQRDIFLVWLPKYFDVHDAFLRATGIDLNVYYAVVLMTLMSFFEEQMLRSTSGEVESGERWHWLRMGGFFAQFEAHRSEAEEILRSWSATPAEYEANYQQWHQDRPTGSPNLDFVPLRMTPLIEARPGELVCPVAHFLLQKVSDEPYFLISDYLQGDELEEFQTDLGNAYEEYAHNLIEVIARSDAGGSWSIEANPPRDPRNPQGGEITDSLLRRGTTGVVFEHKALRPGNEFLAGAGGDRVLGPPDEVLLRLEENKLDATDTKKDDRGLLTRGMNQQTRAASALQAHAQRSFGHDLDRVFPVITHLADFHVGKEIYRIYLEPLIDRNQLYPEDFWEMPQWMHVQDLEYLADWAEHGSLDLEELLSEKGRTARYQRFDGFIAKELNAMRWRPKEQRVYDRSQVALGDAAHLLFPRSAADAQS